MNHIEFVNAGLHNRHIRFTLGGKIYQGVVVDDVFHTEGKTKRTHYTFIPTDHMRRWKEAEQLGDRAMMTALSSVVDIEEINWGEPIDSKEKNIREADLVQYLSELINKKRDFFDDLRLESLIPGSNFRADITVHRRSGNQWQKLLIEVKSFTTFTTSRIIEIIEQLNAYGKLSKESTLVFAFPGVLPEKDNDVIKSQNIEVWDLNYVSSFFAKEIAETPHPTFQSLFTIVGYRSIEARLIKELASIKTGGKKDNEWSRYQKYIGRVIDHLFGEVFSSPISEHSDYFKVNRRDFILRNYAEGGFWAQIRNRYFADYIVVDAKNLSKKITKKEILQISNYLKIHGPGLFGIIFSRNGGDSSSYYTCREIWAMDKKLIIILSDDDLVKMLLSKETNNDPEEIIRQKIEAFRLSM